MILMRNGRVFIYCRLFTSNVCVEMLMGIYKLLWLGVVKGIIEYIGMVFNLEWDGFMIFLYLIRW